MTTTWSPEVALEKVRALLAKAQGTDNPNEARAYSMKAAELADKYRVDLNEAHAAADEPLTFSRHEVNLAGSKSLRATLLLLKVVGTHYGVVTITPSTGNSKTPVLAGAADDIALTLMLFGSLMIQRDREVAATPVPPWATTVTFRNSFAYGYAEAIHERLTELRTRQRRAAEEQFAHAGAADQKSAGSALVLFERADQVMKWLTGEDPNLKRTKGSGHNAPTLDRSGLRAGDAAARRADIGQTRVGANPSARALGAGQ